MITLRKRWGRLISILMIVAMVLPMIPVVPVSASEIPSADEQVVESRSDAEESEESVGAEETEEAGETTESEGSSQTEATTELMTESEESTSAEATTEVEAPEEASTTAGVNSISGFVWKEEVEDGDYTPVHEEFAELNEEPAVGHTIQLLQADDRTVVDQVDTDTDGNYRFEDIAPGEYTVQPKEGGGLLPPTIGLVGRNKIMNEQEDAEFAGTVGKLVVDETSEIVDMDMGMKKLQIRPRAGGVIDISTVTAATAPAGTTFVGNVLTFNIGANGDTYELTGTVSGNNTRRIVVDPNVNVRIALNGISITETSQYPTIASLFEMKAGSDVTLYLPTGSTNTFKTNTFTTSFKGALLASRLTIEGNGSLDAIGGSATGYNSYDGYGAGINIADGSFLHIKSGNLYCEAVGAAIGGGTASSGHGEKGGTIIIDGGNVTAVSYDGAGIGGGTSFHGNYNGGDGGNVTINGGTVIATAKYGAGIGGGSPYYKGLQIGAGGNVKINGGTVRATSDAGAGIGTGYVVYTAASGVNEFTSGNIEATGYQGNRVTSMSTTTNGSVNGSKNVYCVAVTIKDVNGVIVPGATVTIPTLDSSGYTYKAKANAQGVAYCWIPLATGGKKTLFEADDLAVGSGSEELVIVANNNNALTVVLGMRTTLSTTSGVIVFKQNTTDKPEKLKIKAENKVTNTNKRIVGLDWFRVNTTDTTVYTDTNFSTGFSAATTTDKGSNGGVMQEQANGTDALRNYEMPIGANGRYWVKMQYKDGNSINRYQVKEIVVNNIYTQANGTYKGVKATDATYTFYNEPIPDTVIKNKVGIAYDLDDTTALFSTVNGTTRISAASGISGSFSLTGKTIPGGIWVANPTSEVINLTSPNLGTTVFYYGMDPTAAMVDFKPQDGTSTIVPEAYYIKGNPYGTLPILTRSGYNFDGWSKTTSGPIVLATGIVTASHTLFAQWTKKTYPVTINYVDRNNVPISTVVSGTGIVTHGDTYVPASILAITNYIFVDWYPGAVGSTPLKGNKNPSLPNVTGPTQITLVYGQNKNNNLKEDVTITEHHYQGTTLLDKTEAYVDLGDPYTGVPNPTIKPGNRAYTGYRIGSTGSQVVAPARPSLANVNTTYDVYFYYEPVFSLTYHVNGGNSNGPGPVNGLPAQTGYSLSTTGPTHAGNGGKAVVFLGWKASADNKFYGKDDSMPALLSSVNITGDTDVYAVWAYNTNSSGTPDITDIKYRLDYDVDGGNAGTPAPETSVLKQNNYPLSATKPTHPGDSGIAVVFVGWSETKHNKIYTKTDTEPTKITHVDINGNTKVYAIWGYDTTGDGEPDVRKTKYTLTYDTNQGIGGPGIEQNVLIQSNYPLNYTNVPTHAQDNNKNVVFIGWTTARDTKIYAKGDTAPNTPTMINITGSETVYAVWGYDTTGTGEADVKKTQATLTFHENGGPTVATQSLMPGELAVEPTGLTWTGHTFEGWFTDDGSFLNQWDFSQDTITSPTDLYAKWTLETYPIHVRYVDRSGAPVAASPSPDPRVTFGTSFIAPLPTTSVTGMAYVGWYAGTGAPSVATIKKANVTPHISNATIADSGTTITLVYGTDHNNDGVEDVKINIAHTTTTGTTEIGTADYIYVDVDATFNRVADTITGYTDAGKYLDTAGILQTGSPSFVATPDHDGKTVTYQYTLNSYAVNVTYQFRDGQGSLTTLSGSQSETLSHGSTFDSTSTPAFAIPTLLQKTLVGWTLNGTPQTAPVPSISSITGITNIVLIYGQDMDGSGKEDFTITEKHMDGNSVISSRNVYIKKGDNYTGAPDTTLVGYTYKGYDIDSGAVTGTAPATPSLTGVIASHTVELNYEKTKYQVNVSYEYHPNSGPATAIGTPQQADVVHGTNFNAGSTPIPLAVPTFTQKTIIGWKLDGITQTATAPGITNIDRTHNIVLIYGQDMDGDLVQDYTITEKHMSGTTVLATYDHYIPINGTYGGTASGAIGGAVNATVTANGYTYAGYDIDSGTTTGTAPATPVITGVNAEHEVIMNYSVTGYQIDVTYKFKDGTALAGQQNVVIPHNGNFDAGSSPALTAPAFPKKVMIDWTLDGVSKGTTPLGLTSITADHEIVLIYGWDLDEDGSEDFVITERHQGSAGGTLHADTLVPMTNGATYNGAANTTLTSNGYSYLSHKLDTIAGSGLPSISSVTKDYEVIFYYSPDEYLINVTYEYLDNSGTTTAISHPTQTEQIVHGDNFNTTTTPALTIPTISQRVLIDWKLDGVSQGNKIPALTNVTTFHNIVLVYAQDMDNSGTRDYTITEIHQNGILPPVTVLKYVKEGTNYLATTSAPTGYSYATYDIDNGIVSGIAPSLPQLNNVTADHTVTYNYTRITYGVNVSYQYKDGTPLSGSQSENIGQGDNFDSTTTTPLLNIPAFANKVLIDWKLDGVLQGNTTPAITNANNIHNIILIYGQDMGGGPGGTGNGVEDFTVTKQWHDDNNNKLKTLDESVYVDKNNFFNEAHGGLLVTGYDYVGYKIDGGNTVYPGTPNIQVTDDMTITYVYERTTYVITIHYVDSSNTVIKPATTDTGTHGLAFTATDPGISGFTRTGWYLGPVNPSGVALTTAPTIANVTGIADITLVYGPASTGGGSGGGGGGIIPPVKTYTITEKHMSGTNVIKTYNRTVNEGNTYHGAVDSSLLKGYTYTGYVVDNNAMSGKAPSLPTLTNVKADHTVILEYTVDQCEVNVTYEYHANDGKVTSLNGSQKVTVAGGTAFTASIPKFKQKVQTGWTLNGKAQTGKATVKSITGATTIVLIYQQDMDEDNVHDYTIKEVSASNASGKVLQTRTVYIANGKSYTVVPKQINHHTYVGYSVDGGKLQKASNNIFAIKAATPAIQKVNADHTVEMLYIPKVYQVTVKVVDENGKTIGGKGYTVDREYQQQFIASAPQVKDHEFVEWLLDGKKQTGSTVEIASVEKNAVATAVFQKIEEEEQKKKTTKEKQRKEEAKKENYEFIKKPNISNVAAGQTVTYTFSGFGNKWGIPLDKFSIMDKPDKGLDFVSAKLPAFTNGAGVTYSVYYYTKNGKTAQQTLATGLSAATANSFSAPKLKSGDYITMLSLEFDKVPAGFAVGDTMQMSFKVWDNPPAGKLTNIGILSYKVNGEFKEVVSGYGSGSISIDGYFAPPATGDQSSLALTYATMGVSLGGIILLTGSKKRKKRKSA